MVRLVALVLLVGTVLVVGWQDVVTRHNLLWFVLPSFLCVIIPRMIRAWSIRAGHSFSQVWEIILIFVLLWVYLVFLHFSHRFGSS